ERGAVARHPLLAVRSFADEGHPLLEIARRLGGEEIRRQPDHVEMAIGGNSSVLHLPEPPTLDQIPSNRELLPMDCRTPSCMCAVDVSRDVRQLSVSSNLTRSCARGTSDA